MRKGEILGLGGLVGCGRTEIARVLFGIAQPTSGSIRINGKEMQFAGASAAMAAGVAYVSEDRLGQSLVMDFPIVDNAALTMLDSTTTAGFSSRQKVLDRVAPHLDRLHLRFSSYDQPINTLSGGNQQKVVLAKWLATNPQLLILDEPTQGIDVQSKAEVHAMIADLAKQGMAIILITSEMPELLGMCDRIVVLREGRQTAEFSRSQATQEKILRAATDSEPSEPALRLTPNDATRGHPDRPNGAAPRLERASRQTRDGSRRRHAGRRRPGRLHQSADLQRREPHLAGDGRLAADDRGAGADAGARDPQH